MEQQHLGSEVLIRCTTCNGNGIVLGQEDGHTIAVRCPDGCRKGRREGKVRMASKGGKNNDGGGKNDDGAQDDNKAKPVTTTKEDKKHNEKK